MSENRAPLAQRSTRIWPSPVKMETSSLEPRRMWLVLDELPGAMSINEYSVLHILSDSDLNT